MIPHMQTNNGTFYGRYWTETSLLRRYFPSDNALRILSFGCATGEELLMLSRLFPNAALYGCDVDWASLAAARSLMGARAVIFDSGAMPLAAFEPFDLIICNSVLLSHSVDGPMGRRALVPDVWLDAVAKIDAALAPGGILQLINTNFPFRLHPCFERYQRLTSPLILGPHFVDQFDLNGRLLCQGVGGIGFSALLNMHVAGPCWESLEPGDLIDVHFQKAGGTPVRPLMDQRLPNLAARPSLAAGSGTFRPQPPADATSYQTVRLEWASLGAEAVRVERTVVRTWFDGTDLPPVNTTIEMQGGLASAFFEGFLGRPSTSLTQAALDRASPVQSPLL